MVIFLVLKAYFLTKLTIWCPDVEWLQQASTMPNFDEQLKKGNMHRMHESDGTQAIR